MLPAHIQLLERGWLSANSIVLTDAQSATVIDTGYCTHASQTLTLIQTALAGRRLDRVVNTHLHSDHCGGNAVLSAYYGCEILIPPGEAVAVADWDTQALSYEPTGQDCPRFAYTGLVQPNDVLRMGNTDWTALAAPGHDPNSLILYCAEYRVLISADALWENGFGVVFPELDGVDAFNAVAATLDVIEALDIQVILPGHGGAFTDAKGALARARQRLNGFVASPVKHRWHGVKVLCMFWLMAQQRVSRDVALTHLSNARYLTQAAAALGGTAQHVVQQALDEMVDKGQLHFIENYYTVA